MLELLLKWVTGRNVALFFVLCASVWTLDAYQEYPRRAYARLFPPQATARDARGADILGDLDAKESLRLRALHRQVALEIASAGAQGRPVGGLRRLADSALALDRAGYRAQGIDKLNAVRLKIPQGDAVRAVSPDDDRTEIPPDIKGKARGPRKRR
jgi:hypothetical protein